MRRSGMVGLGRTLVPCARSSAPLCVWFCLNTSAHGQRQVAEEDTPDPPTRSFTDVWGTRAMGKLNSRACQLLL